MLKTKKMMEDIKKLKPEDMFVCKKCGADDIQEKAWISVNNTSVVDGLVFHEVYDTVDDTYWCSQCNYECSPITFEQYKEKKDEQNS